MSTPLRASLSTADPEPTLVVAGDPSNPKFATVFVGPPTFTKATELPAGTRLYAHPPAQLPAATPLLLSSTPTVRQYVGLLRDRVRIARQGNRPRFVVLDPLQADEIADALERSL